MQNNVFVNRLLNMKKIKYIGLDMDHTLIRYHSHAFEGLVFQLVLEKLIKEKQYPDIIKKLVFNFKEAIRGLVIDSKNGNILKLSRYGAIRESYHGTKHMTFAEQKIMYRSIYVDLGDPNYFAIDTAFSIAFCVLFSQLVDLKDQHPTNFPNYQTIAIDILTEVDNVHSESHLKAHISKNLDAYVIKEPEVVQGLKNFIEQGKKIFILTNSDYYYTNLLLEHAIEPFMHDGETWRDLFEYVITLANKPRFFYDNLKFLSINPENSQMTNFHGRIKPGIYQGGNARKFTNDLGINGDDILYIGDHIYGDILRLKKDCNWRTALVVEELGEEIASQIKAQPYEKQINLLMKDKMVLEESYLELYNQDRLQHNKQDDMQKIQQQVTQIDKKIGELIQSQQALFNSKWGKIFRTGAEESYFSYQAERFACIYMEKLSCLLSHSPITYFRAHRRTLAHDNE